MLWDELSLLLTAANIEWLLTTTNIFQSLQQILVIDVIMSQLTLILYNTAGSSYLRLLYKMVTDLVKIGMVT